jgi:6-phosphogluconolactonase
MDLRVHPDPDTVARATANLVAFEISDEARTVGLAGGKTPRTAYRMLPGYDLDWNRVTLWVADERWVGSDDPKRNSRMARETFVDRTGAHLIIPDYTLGDPADAADAYTEALQAAFGRKGKPGLVLLGLGNDGHTASLFPGTEALEAIGSRYVANWVPQQQAWRLTATIELLWSARTLVFVVTGAAKASVLAEIFSGNADYPAARVAAGAREVIWIVDKDAAAGL